jgi:hypothetical protein
MILKVAKRIRKRLLEMKKARRKMITRRRIKKVTLQMTSTWNLAKSIPQVWYTFPSPKPPFLSHLLAQT